MAGAPVGNRNASKNRIWEKALRAISIQDPERLRNVAKKVWECAEAGDPWAITELANRLDGKPVQQVEMTGDFTQRLATEYSNAELAMIAAGKDPSADRNESLN
jgi:hypothetical protein